jgi:hypothetical protein
LRLLRKSGRRKEKPTSSLFDVIHATVNTCSKTMKLSRRHTVGTQSVKLRPFIIAKLRPHYIGIGDTNCLVCLPQSNMGSTENYTPPSPHRVDPPIEGWCQTVPKVPVEQPKIHFERPTRRESKPFPKRISRLTRVLSCLAYVIRGCGWCGGGESVFQGLNRFDLRPYFFRTV